MKLLMKTAVFVVLFLNILVSGAQAKDKKPLRIVSLKPNITYILKQLGAESQIVGRTKYCPEVPGAQVVGDYNSYDIEALVRLKPDLVLLSRENSQSRQFGLLKSAKLNVQLFDFSSYDQMATSYEAIAKLVGQSELAATTVRAMNEKLEKLKMKFSHPGQPATLFIVLVQRHPLMVAAGNTYISSLLLRAGLKNAFHHNQVAYPVLDEEEFIREVVAYTFEMTHEPSGESTFLNKEVTPLPIENFLAHPQSVDYLMKVLGQ